MTAETPRRGQRKRRKALSTSTVDASGALVPWLAASGPLSYRPQSPPDRDYFFQYSWVLPGIFADTVNRRRHYYFGSHQREEARLPFSFWEAARAKEVIRVASCTGSLLPNNVAAPLVTYEATTWPGRRRYVLIQHGSYQFVPPDDQPLLSSRQVLLYRGVGDAKKFHLVRRGEHGKDAGGMWRRFLAVQAQVLSDSVRSFNSIHDRTKRCETGHLRDQSWMTNTIAKEHGLDIDAPGPTTDLWDAIHQSYALCRWVAENEFGPNLVALQCPLENIRITTFFAGEHEARIIDPNQLEVVDAHGCRVVEKIV